jgi:hypothetical protein
MLHGFTQGAHMAISKSKQAALNSKIKIASRKLRSAKLDAARKGKAAGAQERVKTHEATIVRLSANKAKPTGTPAHK